MNMIGRICWTSSSYNKGIAPYIMSTERNMGIGIILKEEKDNYESLGSYDIYWLKFKKIIKFKKHFISVWIGDEYGYK